MSNTSTKTIERAEWSQHIEEEQWKFYREVLDAVSAKDIPFARGGGFALAAYTQRWRNSKDIDLLVQPKDRDAVIEVLTGIGYGDFYDRQQYERYWIYRSTRGDNIVDVIWGMRDTRAVVDGDWLNEARSVCVCDRQVKVLSPEILVWGKLYVVIRDRSDWPDVFNIIYGAGPTMDWQSLLNGLGADEPLLAGALRVLTWLCPGRARQLSEWIWEWLSVPEPDPGPDFMEDRLRLLDDLVWLSPTVPPGVLPEF